MVYSHPRYPSTPSMTLLLHPSPLWAYTINTITSLLLVLRGITVLSQACEPCGWSRPKFFSSISVNSFRTIGSIHRNINIRSLTYRHCCYQERCIGERRDMRPSVTMFLTCQVVEIQSNGCIHGLFAKFGFGSCGSSSLRDAGGFIKERCSWKPRNGGGCVGMHSTLFEYSK